MNELEIEALRKENTKRKRIEDELKKHTEHLEELVEERTKELLKRRPPVTGATKPFERSEKTVMERPPHQQGDHRYAHPSHRHVRKHPRAHHPPPPASYYTPCYTHWWIHPYYRHYHSTTVVVWFPFAVYPWATWWAP